MSKEMLKWLNFAIDAEKKGIEVYTKCRTLIKNPRAIEFFDFLIRVEHGHKAVLTALLAAESGGDKGLMSKSVDDFLKSGLKNPIFKKDTADNLLKPSATLHDLFNTALVLEADGAKLYAGMALEQTDPKLETLFKKLSKDEEEHKKELANLGLFVFQVAPPDATVDD
jgi:rubrerythrin